MKFSRKMVCSQKMSHAATVSHGRIYSLCSTHHFDFHSAACWTLSFPWCQNVLVQMIKTFWHLGNSRVQHAPQGGSTASWRGHCSLDARCFEGLSITHEASGKTPTWQWKSPLQDMKHNPQCSVAGLDYYKVANP